MVLIIYIWVAFDKLVQVLIYFAVLSASCVEVLWSLP